MMWLTSVVLPEDSGPKISTIRPRGTPPMPSARSSAREPVGIASTLTVPLSPRRISEPSPNSFRMPLTAFSSAASFAFASFAETSFKVTLLIRHLDHLTAASAGQLDLCQRHVARTGRLEFRTVERHPDGRIGPPRAPRAASRAARRRPPAASIPAPRDAPGRRSHAARTAASRARRSPPRRVSAPARPAAPRRPARAPAAQQPRPAPRRPLHRVAQLHPGRRPGALPHHRGDLLDLLLRPVAEEGEGDVQRLGRTGRSAGSASASLPQATIPSRISSGRSSATNRRARGLFSRLLCHGRHATGRRAHETTPQSKFLATTSCAALRSPSSCRSRCIPTRAERSRMSARPPGITGSRAMLVPSARRALKQT